MSTHFFILMTIPPLHGRPHLTNTKVSAPNTSAHAAHRSHTAQHQRQTRVPQAARGRHAPWKRSRVPPQDAGMASSKSGGQRTLTALQLCFRREGRRAAMPHTRGTLCAEKCHRRRCRAPRHREHPQPLSRGTWSARGRESVSVGARTSLRNL